MIILYEESCEKEEYCLRLMNSVSVGETVLKRVAMNKVREKV